MAVDCKNPPTACSGGLQCINEEPLEKFLYSGKTKGKSMKREILITGYFQNLTGQGHGQPALALKLPCFEHQVGLGTPQLISDSANFPE